MNKELTEFKNVDFFKHNSLTHDEKNDMIYQLVKNHLNLKEIQSKEKNPHSKYFMMFYGFILTLSIFKYFTH